ncbi:unnamed protein product [Bemisia tabaci]|uniref:J domain-containing protein n=1 Tax=Bemisia tabaci TaxID=7038 RepID=A0A9P0A854_BEMTA|nr:unnamed protein product [Bemisia tabaci]
MDCLHSPAVKICSTWIIFAALDTLITGALVSAFPKQYAGYAVILPFIFPVSSDSSHSGKPSSVEVKKHLELGGEFLSKGQLQDALSHYHAAVEGDPENYLTYFKRGTVYFALGKASLAFSDFDKALELKPDFDAAKYQRGVVSMKQADLTQALKDFNDIWQTSSEQSADAKEQLDKVNRLVDIIEFAEHSFNKKDYQTSIQYLTSAIELCPWAPRLRDLRASSYLAINDLTYAINDLRSATKLIPDNTDGYYKLSKLFYEIGKVQDALREIRECLKLDPEHKLCFPHYKVVKKVDKLLAEAQQNLDEQDYESCISNAKKVLKTETKEQQIIFLANEKLCQCYLKSGQVSQSLTACNEALEIEKTASLYCDLAEAHIAADMFAEAIHDYKEALEIESGYQRAEEGIKRAQKLQKQSEKRDYYKILGVSRNANKQEITKAYRKAAQKWHPDNFQGEEKKMAEKKFIDIAAAKEVLTDPEKRQKFDQGEDPLDPEGQGQQQGFNPFQQFHQFHGSPFQFKFHFH